MYKLLLSIGVIFCLVTQAQSANLTSTMVVGELFYSSDTDSNTVTRVTASDWLASKSENKIDSIYQSPLQDWYSKGDVSFDLSGGKPLVQVSTRDSGNPAGAYMEFDKTISMKDKSLRFRVKADNWKALDGFSIILSSDGAKLANSITLDIKTHIINPTDNEWFEIVAPVSDWIVDGTPDLSALNALLWKVQDKGPGHVTTQIDDLAIIPNVKAAVSITVDDGLSSATDAKLIMGKYKLRGSICIDETALGSAGFLTQAQVDEFARDGWDISGHQVMHNFRKSTEKEVADYVEATSTYLKKHNYQGANIYAYPNGINDPKVNAAVAKNFAYGMDIDGLSNTLGYIPNYRINRKSFDRFTTLDQMKWWILDAQANHEWLILNFHTVDPEADTDENIDPSEFDLLMKFLQEQQVTVAPVSEILKSSSPVEPISLDVTNVTKKKSDSENKPSEFGVSYSRARYQNSIDLFNADTISLLTNVHRGDYALVGQLGVGSLSSHSYFVGDANWYYFTSNIFAWTAGLNGDIVDSPQGLVKGINTVGLTTGFDYDPAVGGLSVAIKHFQYSDSNQRTGWIGKAYVNVNEGINLYIYTDQYHDNMVSSDYFSPNNYARYSLGIGFRKKYDKYSVTGKVDDGRADADGEWSPAYSWKLLLETPLNSAWSTKVTVGSDRSSSSNYQYSYLNAVVQHPF